MASLYIKKAETADLAREVAALLGITKTDAVHDSLLRRKEELTQAAARNADAIKARADDMRERLDAWRAAHPLPHPTGKADKAFFDEMWGEGSD